MIQPMSTQGGVFVVAMVAGLILLFPGAVSAGPAPPPPAVTITADDSCCEFDLDFYEQSRGEVATFENPAGADAPHNVVSIVRDLEGRPLFRSETIAAGSTSPVEGTQYLNEGEYPFFCTLHGLSMGGQLEVSSQGTVVPRPAARLAIPTQKLRTVRKSGIIKVSAKALVGSPVLSISAKSGAVTVASAGGIRLGPGATRTVRLKLSRAGRKAVSKGRRAVISVRGSVEFGSPVSAKRTVR
jgi:plastocyanin